MVTGSSILLTQVVEDFFRENEFFGIREQACERHTRKGKNIGSKIYLYWLLFVLSDRSFSVSRGAFGIFHV